MQRRQFLRVSALGAGAVVLHRALPQAAAAPDPAVFDPFEPVQLGRTNVKFPRVIIGTGVRGGMRQCNLTRAGKDKAVALFQGAYERGVRVFDLADLYGTHPFLMPALKSFPRDQYGVVSKIWFRPGALPENERPDADAVVDRFRKEIGTDYLDLVLLHCVTDADWPTKLRKQMDLLEGLKQKGVIRAHGVSCHSIAALEAAAKEPWVDSVHTRINPYGAKMDGPVEKVLPVVRQFKDAGKGVVAMKIMGEGDFRNDEEKKNASIKFVLTEARADWLAVGFEALDEIDDFAARVRKVPRA